jgi:hypothetical protein
MYRKEICKNIILTDDTIEWIEGCMYAYVVVPKKHIARPCNFLNI